MKGLLTWIIIVVTVAINISSRTFLAARDSGGMLLLGFAHTQYYSNTILRMNQANHRNKLRKVTFNLWAVVVTQLEEWSLPTPEVSGSNPVIGKNLY